MKKLIALINGLDLKRSALQYRNAARLLGGRANWEKRLVTESFGKDVCNQALALAPAALKQTKDALTSLFEARFTDEDRAMEIALKKAAEKVYSDCYETEEEI